MNSPAHVSLQCSRHTPCAVAAYRLSCHDFQRIDHNRIGRADGTRSVPATFRRGLSLMELLIATTISIMLMAATVTLFGVVGDKVNAGRAMIETGDRLRATRSRLSADLRGVTAPMLPWGQPASGDGYFEIIKGPAPNNRDANPNSTLVGYTQDVLMLTTRSRDVPFTGRFFNLSNGSLTTIESQVAEVAWYMQPTFNAQGQQQYLDQGTKTPLYTLYRRQFLVFPSPTVMSLTSTTVPWASYTNKLEGFYDYFDISAHPDTNGNMVANSLADLAYRENRFAHNNINGNAPAPYLLSNILTPAKTPAFVNPPTTTDALNTNFDALVPFQPTYSSNGTANPAGSQRAMARMSR